jgi:hypothetical protein
VLLWEILTCCRTFPYEEYYDEIVLVTLIENGLRLPRPSRATDGVYDLMLRCWSIEPDDRPPFANIVKDLPTLLKAVISDASFSVPPPAFTSAAPRHPPAYKRMNTAQLRQIGNDLAQPSVPAHVPAAPITARSPYQNVTPSGVPLAQVDPTSVPPGSIQFQPQVMQQPGRSTSVSVAAGVTVTRQVTAQRTVRRETDDYPDESQGINQLLVGSMSYLKIQSIIVCCMCPSQERNTIIASHV